MPGPPPRKPDRAVPRAYGRRRHIGWVAVAAAALLISGAPVGMPHAAGATVDTGAWYVFVNRHSDK